MDFSRRDELHVLPHVGRWYQFPSSLFVRADHPKKWHPKCKPTGSVGRVHPVSWCATVLGSFAARNFHGFYKATIYKPSSYLQKHIGNSENVKDMELFFKTCLTNTKWNNQSLVEKNWKRSFATAPPPRIACPAARATALRFWYSGNPDTGLLVSPMMRTVQPISCQRK